MNGKKLLLASALLVSTLASCSSSSKEWTVNFDVDSISPQKVKDGDVATKPADPTKADADGYIYTFAYWAKDGTEYDFSTPVHSDFTLTAVWTSEKQTCVLTFDSDGGTSVDPISVRYGEIATAPANPTKEATAQYNYTFEYWYATDSKTAFDFTKPITSSLTLKAKWKEEVRQYTVTFLDTDGTTVLQTTSYDYGATPVYSGKTLSKDPTDEFEYTLTWSPSIVAVTGDATYTASFTETKRKYAVTFDSDGGSEVEAQSIEYGAKATAPTAPTKSSDKGDYEFLGWYSGDSVYDFDSEVKGAVSLKAKWGNLYKNASKNADGTITLSKMASGGNITDGYSVAASYVAFEGDYGVGTTLGFRFTGKNIPNVGLFASSVGSPVGGTDGMYLSTGTNENDASLSDRMTVYGPHMLDSGNPSDYSTYNGLGYNDRLEAQTGSPFGYTNLEDDKDYLYKVTTAESSSGVQLILDLNEVKADGTIIGLASFNKVIKYTGSKTGNVIVYGSFRDDITLEIMELNSDIPSADIVTYKSSLDGNKVTLNSGTRADDSYLGLKAGVTVGDTIKINYTGKNLPNVALLCDSNSGQAIGGGQGVYLANSYVTNLANDGNAKRLMPYGPYRWSTADNYSGWDIKYRYANSLDTKMGYTNMEDDASYEFTIKVDSIVEDTVKITINLKNLTADTNVTNRTLTLDGLNGSLQTGDTLNLGDNVIFYGHEKAVTFTYEFIKGEK